MVHIDYKKVFSKLSHIKALSHDQKFDEIVQNLITHTLNQITGDGPTNDTELSGFIHDIYGISIRPKILLSNVDKLLAKGDLIRDPVSKQLSITLSVVNSLRERIHESIQIEEKVKSVWFQELIINKTDISDDELTVLWKCLNLYLCAVFEQHGIQTLHLLNPNAKIMEDDQKGLFAIIEEVLEEVNTPPTKELLILAINQFIANADELRTQYISQLADSTFTSFALTSDAETVNFLNQRYNDLQLFLDTNFIFGILDLHRNNEDASAREILEEVKRNRLPFKLAYHPETLYEFKRAFDARAMHIRASKWSRESSRVAIEIGNLSPLEDEFHRQNIENEIDPSVFLDKYDHVDDILKDLGLLEFIPRTVITSDEYVEIESDIEKYQDFYNAIPNRKPKSFLGFKHDVIVIREVRRLNPKKTKFLDSNAFFISSDFILAKFENKHYKRSWEINYVVSPSVFLQLIRPFIENDYSSNKRFVETFSIPELRAFEIDYSSTRSKALQILNDSYHGTSFETKVKILRDQVILEKLEQVKEDFDKQIDIIEKQIAIENHILTEEKAEALANIEELRTKTTIAEHERIVAREETENISNELKIITQEFELSKRKSLTEQIDYKKALMMRLDKSISSANERKIPLMRIIRDKSRNLVFRYTLLPIAYVIIMILLISHYSWNVMEPYTFILSLILALVGYVYLAVKGESFNPARYFHYRSKAIEAQIFKEFAFYNEQLDNEMLERDSLELEIRKLEHELSQSL